MINSDPETTHIGSSEDDVVDAIVRSGAWGGVALAGIATAVVIGLWFAFYFLVFMPRVPSP